MAENKTEELESRIENIEKMLSILVRSDKYTFQKDLQLQDGRDIQIGTGTGSHIGTAATDKLAFYGVTPVVQAGAISAPTGGATIDAEARTAINSIRTAIKNMGITA